MFSGAAQLAKVANTKRISHQQKAGTSFIGVAFFIPSGASFLNYLGATKEIEKCVPQASSKCEGQGCHSMLQCKGKADKQHGSPSCRKQVIWNMAYARTRRREAKHGMFRTLTDGTAAPDGIKKRHSDVCPDFRKFPSFPVCPCMVRLECPVARPLSRLKVEGAREEQGRKATRADGTKNGPRRIPRFKL